MNGALGRLRAALGEAELVLVGGAVRDELLGRPHGDWDLATDLLPEEVMARGRRAGLKCLPTGLQHGTVTVVVGGDAFEITTYRADSAYSDGRHPDRVVLGVTLEEDLSRRDFTINAMALPVGPEGELAPPSQVVDPFGGREDLARKRLRAVGNPLARFQEDGLRPLRACRFAAQLGFDLDPETAAAIPKRLEVASKVAVERAFTELTKLLCGKHASSGLRQLASTGLLDLWLPELRAMQGCGQNRHHRYDVWEHTLRAVELGKVLLPAHRWALLLHDVGKPPTRTVDEQGEVHFYGHEARSVDLAESMLRRLKASNQLIHEVTAFVRHHGVHPTPEWTDAACRRFLGKLLADGLDLPGWTLFRLADQWAKGWGDPPVPAGRMAPELWIAEVRERCDAVEARLQALLDAKPPLTPKDLALDGRALMALAGRPGGPWLGALQRRLLDAVLEEPGLNNPSDLKRLSEQMLAG
jgi:tRNA nucleotidyltransferase/poly(A) polymerase